MTLNPLNPPQTIYRYGWLAWVWRGLVAAAACASALLVHFAAQFGDWTLVAIALPLVAPSVLLWPLAVRIDRQGDVVTVTNGFFVRRRIEKSSLGRPRVRLTAQGAILHIAAPRAWIPVQGALPIYVDLYADIPDPADFRRFFGLPREKAP